MTPSDPGEVRIRNRRYWPWMEILGVMLFALFAFAECGLFWAGLDRLMLYCMLGAGLGMAAYCTYVFLRVWDLREGPVADRGVTARAAVRCLVLGIRRKELGPAVARTALGVIRGLLPSRISVDKLILGEDVDFDSRIRIPARAVRRVRFAPDPAEDYLESERPVRLCEAAVEMDSGKQFRLILDEADAQQLRQWAATKGIAVCDCDGYRPRPVETANET